MAAYQTTYGERIAPPMPGVQAGSISDIETGICETASPGIPFGRAVSQGANSDQGRVLGGVLANFRGVSMRDITLAAKDVTDVTLDKYQIPNSMGHMVMGEVWVEPGEAVLANDPVFYNSTTGVFFKAAGAGLVGPVKGASFKTSAGVGGRAVLKLSGYRRAD